MRLVVFLFLAHDSTPQCFQVRRRVFWHP
jgi:hypothetical protein